MTSARRDSWRSTSRYRRELLAGCALPFDVGAPGRGRDAHAPANRPRHWLSRLAHAKAAALLAANPDAWVIGSDQVADLDGQPLGKPGGRDAAIAQLLRDVGPRGRVPHRGQPGPCADGNTSMRWTSRRSASVRLRRRRDRRYVDAEQPFDCAGSFKSEGLGIALFDAIDVARSDRAHRPAADRHGAPAAPGGIRHSLTASATM